MGNPPAGARPIVYCIVPSELAGKLHEPLRRHFRDDPGVQVVVERRAGERRRARRRRTGAAAEPATDRRRITGTEGRRVADRRAQLLSSDPPSLPRRARAHAAELAFVERIEPGPQQFEDVDTARLVMRFQAGDESAFADIYLRYFDRLYGYFRVALRHRQEAEDATQQVFVKVFESLPRYERRAQPFRGWLSVVARNYVIDHLRKHGRVDLEEASEMERRRDRLEEGDGGLDALGWVSDRDLVMLIERLPIPQRQVLVLRYAFGLTTAETAQVLDRTQDSVRMLQSRAQAYLRQRLTALGRAPTHRGKARMRAWPRQARVLRARRFTLNAPGPSR